MITEEAELRAAVARVLEYPSRKKLIVAGPGTGKTTLFRIMLEGSEGNPKRNLVLTFINNLRSDLEKELSGLASVYTLHSYCLGLLHRKATLRSGLSSSFRVFPGLGSLVRADWRHIEKSEAPHFIREMRNLDEYSHIQFYLERGIYYEAVDFDDTVYRVYEQSALGTESFGDYDLVLIDEYQDFNRMEAAIISRLALNNPIMIVGDDDQALYSQLRDSSWDYIRTLYSAGDYEVFELPFCMRCPKVVVDAVSDVITRARQMKKLQGRIDKSFRHFAPVKGADSTKYPTIDVIKTSVQRQKANYIGRYIAQAIASIPRQEVEEATKTGYPPVLVIAARPYRAQIIDHLENSGHTVETRRDPGGRLDHTSGIAILKEDQKSNLGWRIVLEVEKPLFLAETIAKTANGSQQLSDIIPNDFRDRILSEVNAWEPQSVEPDDEFIVGDGRDALTVRITSFEGAKGLSAQHVFIVGLHNGEIPQHPRDIQDLEICKFVVGLTRTRKKCSLIYTGRFANQRKSPSLFISWIDSGRLERITVNKEYWRKQNKHKE
jgi:superfamily I DNA/RNA helicase